MLRSMEVGGNQVRYRIITQPYNFIPLCIISYRLRKGQMFRLMLLPNDSVFPTPSVDLFFSR